MTYPFMKIINALYRLQPCTWSGVYRLIVIFCGLSASAMLHADEAEQNHEECGRSEIRYIDNPELTRAERIAMMEKAFMDSLNRFELCQLTDPEQNSSNTSQADQGGGLDGSDGGDESVASQDMQGSEPESAASLPEEGAGASEQQAMESPASSSAPISRADNGAIPEDIPAANNDDAIAAQIRLAAEAEQDPEIRKKLWNEYRKYKGMKIVED